jgi:adenylate cyclase
VADSHPSAKTVLIIEDSAIARAGLAAVLSHHGYAVTTAPTGEVALDLVLGGITLDVILLDMLMPDVDGWRFLEDLKRTRGRSVPVIVMSGVGMSLEWAVDNGCVGFLRKPFGDRDLFATITRAIKPV